MSNPDKITYNPATGIFSKGGRPLNPTYNKQGNPVISWNVKDSKGNMIKRIRVMAARAAWQFHTGKPPRDGFYVRFIDGDKTNLRISNLEEIPLAARPLKISCKNTSGFRGVSKEYNGKWRASFRRTIKGVIKTIRVGAFDSPAEAAEAAKKAREDFYEKLANQK